MGNLVGILRSLRDIGKLRDIVTQLESEGLGEASRDVSPSGNVQYLFRSEHIRLYIWPSRREHTVDRSKYLAVVVCDSLDRLLGCVHTPYSAEVLHRLLTQFEKVPPVAEPWANLWARIFDTSGQDLHAVLKSPLTERVVFEALSCPDQTPFALHLYPVPRGEVLGRQHLYVTTPPQYFR